MVLIFIQNIATSASLIQSAYALAVQLKKRFGVLVICSSSADEKVQEASISEQLKTLSIQADYLRVQVFQLNDLTTLCETEEVSFLFLQLSDNKSRTIKNTYKPVEGCAYLICCIKTILMFASSKLLIGQFFNEEIEKAQFAAAFGRFCQSGITFCRQVTAQKQLRM